PPHVGIIRIGSLPPAGRPLTCAVGGALETVVETLQKRARASIKLVQRLLGGIVSIPHGAAGKARFQPFSTSDKKPSGATLIAGLADRDDKVGIQPILTAAGGSDRKHRKPCLPGAGFNAGQRLIVIEIQAFVESTRKLNKL